MNPIKTDALLLVVALSVAAGAAWLTGSLTAWAVGVAAMAFTITLAIVMFVRQMEFSRKISRIERGLMDYEASVSERIGKISASSVSRDELEKLKRELQLERASQRITEAASKTQPSSNQPVSASEADPEENVVPFLRVVSDADKSETATPKRKRKGQTSGKRELTLYLEPIIGLNERQTMAFNIVPGIVNDDGTFSPMADKRDAMKGNISAARADLILLEQAFDLLRSLDLEGTDVKFNLPVTGGAIESKKLFKEVMRLLKLHDRFSGKLFLTLPQDVLGSFNRAALSRLIEVRDAGFGLMLEDCSSIAEALLVVSEGHADGIFVDITALRQIMTAGENNPELDLVSQASQSGVPFIVTNVAFEAQVMELLDFSIDLAAGSYFSDPKPPKTGLRGNEPAQA